MRYKLRVTLAAIFAVLAILNLGFGVFYYTKGHGYLTPINLIGAFWACFSCLDAWMARNDLP